MRTLPNWFRLQQTRRQRDLVLQPPAQAMVVVSREEQLLQRGNEIRPAEHVICTPLRPSSSAPRRGTRPCAGLKQLLADVGEQLRIAIVDHRFDDRDKFRGRIA